MPKRNQQPEPEVVVYFPAVTLADYTKMYNQCAEARDAYQKLSVQYTEQQKKFLSLAGVHDVAEAKRSALEQENQRLRERIAELEAQQAPPPVAKTDQGMQTKLSVARRKERSCQTTTILAVHECQTDPCYPPTTAVLAAQECQTDPCYILPEPTVIDMAPLDLPELIVCGPLELEDSPVAAILADRPILAGLAPDSPVPDDILPPQEPVLDESPIPALAQEEMAISEDEDDVPLISLCKTTKTGPSAKTRAQRRRRTAKMARSLLMDLANAAAEHGMQSQAITQAVSETVQVIVDKAIATAHPDIKKKKAKKLRPSCANQEDEPVQHEVVHKIMNEIASALGVQASNTPKNRGEALYDKMFSFVFQAPRPAYSAPYEEGITEPLIDAYIYVAVGHDKLGMTHCNQARTRFRLMWLDKESHRVRCSPEGSLLTILAWIDNPFTMKLCNSHYPDVFDPSFRMLATPDEVMQYRDQIYLTFAKVVHAYREVFVCLKLRSSDRRDALGLRCYAISVYVLDRPDEPMICSMVQLILWAFSGRLAYFVSITGT